MADSSTNEIPDSQATYYENSQSQQATSSLNLSESQDFQLIDTSNTEDFNSQPLLHNDAAEPMSKAPVKVNSSQDQLSSADFEDNLVSESKANENQTKDRPQESNNDKVETSSVLDDTQDLLDECASSQTPLGSQNENLGHSKCLKRKASNPGEEAHKFPRTNSGQDAFSTERNKDQDNGPQIDTDSSQIIPETQEIPDSQNPDSVEDIAKVDSKKLSSHETGSVKLADTSTDENLNNSSGLFQSDLSDCFKQVNDNAASDIDFRESDNNIEANLEKIFDEPIQENDKAIISDGHITNNHQNDKNSENTKEIADNEIEKSLEKMFDNEIQDQKNLEMRSSKVSTSTIDVIASLAEDQDKVESNHHLDVPPPRKDDSGISGEMTFTNSDLKSTSSMNGTNDTLDSKDETKDTTSSFEKASKSRKSIEVIYDKATVKSKPKELVEIDESGEKIVLDSSHEEMNSKVSDKIEVSEGETIYVSCVDKTRSTGSFKSLKDSQDSTLNITKLNGSTDDKKDSVEIVSDEGLKEILKKYAEPVKNTSNEKSMVVISDSDNSLIEDPAKNKFLEDARLNVNENIKLTQIEKEISFTVKVKYLLSIDDNTKEICHKDLLNATCEPGATHSRHQKAIDSSSACLADISVSDNKDESPASVNSNPQLFRLQPTRLSFVSTISSSSSGSSAISAVAKSQKDTEFSQPHGPAKHAKKSGNDSSPDHKEGVYEKLVGNWKNGSVLVSSIFNFLNAEITAADSKDTDLLENSEKLASSTPEVQVKKKNKKSTLKSVKKGRVTKQSRNSRVLDPSDVQASFSDKQSRKTGAPATPKTPRQPKVSDEPLPPELEQYLDQQVFAKWSDNNYYPGHVHDIVKTKVKVDFLDGKTKLLLPDFVLLIKGNLSKGSSVLAYVDENDDYGSPVMIVDTKEQDDNVIYIVETDDGKRIERRIDDLFLTSDQAKLLKEQDVANPSIPSTPQQLSSINTNNIVDSQRRSRKTATPSLETPRSRKKLSMTNNIDTAGPSGSGMQNKSGRKKTSDSDSYQSASDKEQANLLGLQNEIIGTFNEQTLKGPASKMKGKSKGQKKPDYQADVETLGPIPKTDSDIFKGFSFILTCVSVDTLDKFQQKSQETIDSNSEPGTENEEQWMKRPFVRDRLETQITAGGGKIYHNFDDIPPEEYPNTKHITNLPNLTKKALLCLSVGIKSYNHQWVIRSCQENKLITPAEEELPAGWSLDKKVYIDTFQRPKAKPLEHTIVAIPSTDSEQEFVNFWKRICENAGASVQLLQDPEQNFMEATVVLANKKCPIWVTRKSEAWQIPILSPTWIEQCLIEGKLCPDSKAEYQHSSSNS